MKKILLWAGLLVMAIGSAHAGDYYRGVSKNGKVKYYGDQPPAAEGIVVEKKKFAVAPDPENAELPYETRRAMQRFPVTLYTQNSCKDACAHARDFLNKRGIPFTETILATQKEIDSFKAQSGNDTIPTVSIGKDYVQNFSAEKWNTELDIAGYPTTAPYRPKANAQPSSDKQQQQEEAP